MSFVINMSSKEYNTKYYELNREKLLAQKKRYREENRLKIYEKNKKYRLSNKEKVNELARKYYSTHKENIRASTLRWEKKNPEARKNIDKRFRENNPEKRVKTWKKSNLKRRDVLKEYRAKNKDKIKEYFRNRLKNDIQYRLSSTLRSRMWGALKRNKKSGSAIRDLGCTLLELKKHIELKFTDGMNWGNWSRDGWHIDHIIPLCNFDLTDREQYLKACHYTNLQPLWAIDNLTKKKYTE